MENKLKNLIVKLDNIAKKNNDEFRYKINIDFKKYNELHIHFIAEETVDNHVFITGGGFTIDNALKVAELSIDDACKSWGYKQ